MPVGGGSPVTVQSMTTTKTADVDGTLAQIYSLAAAGCDIVRCTCNEEPAAEGLAQIVPRSPVPLIADIHFQYKLALAAMEAGVAGLRLNPGNIRKPEHIKVVAREAKDRGLPIRIGVNAGSPRPRHRRAVRRSDARSAGRVGGARARLLRRGRVRRRQDLGEVVERAGDDRRVPPAVGDRRHPLHLGVTEAGPLPAGLVKSTAGIATLLAEGIGDTIRFSLTADPVEEAKAGRQLLEAMGLRERKGLDLIACPSCGRAEVDVIKVARDAMAALETRNIPLQVAVMGCVVNGPGEAAGADLGIAAGRGKGHLFVRGKVVRVVPEADMVTALVDEAEKIVAEGIEARLAAADENAEAIAAATREELLQIQGLDANRSDEKIDKIREIAD